MESLIGGSWLLWAGILAVTFGVAFFLKYAFENDWIGPAGRVLLGAAAGCAILFAGERLRLRGLRYYAFVLTGGGILILYLSVYAAYNFYQLVGQPTAFLLMVAVTATAVLLSARYHALPIAVLGLVGGFLTPPLLSTGQDNQVGLFTYVALLDAGVLTLAYFKRWRSLNFMSFGATVLMFLGWMVRHYAAAKLWPTVLFLSLFFLLYSALTLVFNVLRRRVADWPDILLVSANAAFFFGLAYKLLDDAGYDPWLGSFALCVSAFYLLFYYTTRRLHGADRLLLYSLLGASVTFVTIAVAAQLDGPVVTIAWAAEAAMLVWVGLRAGERAARHSAVLVFAAAVAHWLTHDVPEFAYRAGQFFTPFFNGRAAACAALVAACAVVVRLYRGACGEVEEGERRTMTNVALLAANLLALALLTVDTNDYFQHLRVLEPPDSADGVPRVENWRLLALAFVWTVYGVVAFAVGAWRGRRPVRYGGL
ncbi:MAG TPA: DUF2339 domain-containing protein, partial [Pyrinomonadaceae bacterium]|nr:DUF2339 domain-containing protein [Pyrinomonadaceae bacterium]